MLALRQSDNTVSIPRGTHLSRNNERTYHMEGSTSWEEPEGSFVSRCPLPPLCGFPIFPIFGTQYLRKKKLKVHSFVNVVCLVVGSTSLWTMTLDLVSSIQKKAVNIPKIWKKRWEFTVNLFFGSFNSTKPSQGATKRNFVEDKCRF